MDRKKVFDAAKKVLLPSLTGKNLRALCVVLDCLSALHLTEDEIKDILSSLQHLQNSISNKYIRREHVDTLYAWVFRLNIENGWTFEIFENWLKMPSWVLQGSEIQYLDR